MPGSRYLRHVGLGHRLMLLSSTDRDLFNSPSSASETGEEESPKTDLSLAFAGARSQVETSRVAASQVAAPFSSIPHWTSVEYKSFHKRTWGRKGTAQKLGQKKMLSLGQGVAGPQQAAQRQAQHQPLASPEHPSRQKPNPHSHNFHGIIG